jgi:hypothetical protein
VLRFLANFALFCQQTNSATFLFSQALIVSELTRNYRLKIKALIGLATCARRYHRLSSQIGSNSTSWPLNYFARP